MGLYTENAHVAFYLATKAVAEKVVINGESTGGFKSRCWSLQCVQRSSDCTNSFQENTCSRTALLWGSDYISSEGSVTWN